ncbi:bifunctional riboflavin kinase/FAD synthetase [Benzoatithermus flavus]|uniref:Riboflavin biosynthesis protein n=1 Tax=Benzoatithermus flavus TaxID=3108223 RepID=A0ABU8XSQ7_9PROT
MRIHRDHASLPAAARGASVAIGNFDGVHRGHREVIRVAADHARALGRPLGVITFEPHPREVLNPAEAPARLTPLRRKARILRDLGVEHLYVLRFDARLMRVPAAAFVNEILVGELGVAAVTTGRDFRFGHKRQGDVALLAALAAGHGIPVSAVDPVTFEGDVCSSTAIRAALAEGRIAHANAILGYPYELDGVVRPGDRRGRTLGFPTANVHPLARRPMLPAHGVYAVKAGLRRGGGTVWHPAVANLGRRPTFDGKGTLLEVHLLEGGGDLYGERLRVAFLERLRGEEKFSSIEALRAQIARDCERARAVHALIPA